MNKMMMIRLGYLSSRDEDDTNDDESEDEDDKTDEDD